MIHRFAAALLCAVIVAGPLAAQRAAPPFPRFAPTLSAHEAAAPAPAAMAFGHPSDYRWEGVIAGGVALGVASAIVVGAMCTQDSGATESCGYYLVMATLGGASAGAVIGGLIGGLIPKAPADSSRAGP